MNRRSFLIQSAALCLAAGTPLTALAAPAHAAAPFSPTRFSVEVRGDGPDVILIPGLTSGPHVWQEAIRAVPGYRYHLVHVAGFSGAPARGNADGAVVAPLADEIARYIEAEGLKRPAVVGHSMGGILAMMVAARRPTLIGKVMVVDMMPKPTSLYGGSGASRLAAGLGDMIADPQARRLLSSLVSAFSPPAARERASDPDVVARAMHDLGVTDLTGELADIRAPITVVYAVRTDEERAATERAFARAYAPARSARLVPIDGSGHLVMADQPGRFADTLRNFLGERRPEATNPRPRG